MTDDTPLEANGPGWIVRERQRRLLAHRAAAEVSGHVPLRMPDRDGFETND